MVSSIVIVIILFLFLLFFMFYKRDMLIKMFSIDVTSSANQFQEQLEETADIVIKRLEEQIIHLEDLLEAANITSINLDNRILIVNQLAEKEEVRGQVKAEKNKQLEEQILHLENILENANEKITTLDNILQIANEVIEKAQVQEQKEAQAKAEEKEQKNKRLEEQIIHLEDLLEKANEKMRPILETTHLVVPEITVEENEIVSFNEIIDITKDTDEIPSVVREEYKGTIHGDKRSSIVEMADLGYDINEIAKTTGISKGEIILLLQLNKK